MWSRDNMTYRYDSLPGKSTRSSSSSRYSKRKRSRVQMVVPRERLSRSCIYQKRFIHRRGARQRALLGRVALLGTRRA